jgi:hypothetical protein
MHTESPDDRSAVPAPDERDESSGRSDRTMDALRRGARDARTGAAANRPQGSEGRRFEQAQLPALERNTRHREDAMTTRFNTDNPRMGLGFVTCISALLFALLAACGGTPGGVEDDTLYAHAFAGEVNEDLFIGAMVADHPRGPDRKALVVYLCDGADVSTWFFGEAIGDAVVLEGADIRVEMSLGEERLTGVVERAGVGPQGFVAEFAAGDAGLYRAVETFDGTDYIGGWVVLNDGRQRGALTLGGQVIENPTLDLTTGQAETSVGTFGTNCFINPHTGERICRWLN